MMTLTSLLVVCLLTVANGELLNMLHTLHTWDGFNYLSTEEKVLVTEILAAAESCKLTTYLASVGRSKVDALIVHLPSQDETYAQTALQDHEKFDFLYSTANNYLHKEQIGTCRVT